MHVVVEHTMGRRKIEVAPDTTIKGLLNLWASQQASEGMPAFGLKTIETVEDACDVFQPQFGGKILVVGTLEGGRMSTRGPDLLPKCDDTLRDCDILDGSVLCLVFGVSS